MIIYVKGKEASKVCQPYCISPNRTDVPVELVAGCRYFSELLAKQKTLPLAEVADYAERG
jgi:hypothetical protein